MDLDAIADELYGLPLESFTSARSEWERQAKGEKDTKLAAEVHHLAKPNAVAWLINQLVRNHGADIERLQALGTEMREATDQLAGDRLRDLASQRRQVIGELIQKAKDLTRESERQFSADTDTRPRRDIPCRPRRSTCFGCRHLGPTDQGSRLLRVRQWRKPRTSQSTEAEGQGGHQNASDITAGAGVEGRTF